MTFKAFSALVLATFIDARPGALVNAFVVAYDLKATRSRSTRANIELALAFLAIEGYLTRDDLAVTGAAPCYERTNLR